MELLTINLIFFNVVGFIVCCTCGWLLWKRRDTVFLPVHKGVPYWYNSEDDLQYTKPMVSNPQEEIRKMEETLKASVPTPNNNYSFSVEQDFEESLKDLDKFELPKARRGVRK